MFKLKAPISTIMSDKLITVNHSDNLEIVKYVFNTYHIHHIPVLNGEELVGIISKSDFLAVSSGLGRIDRTAADEEEFLHKHTAEEVMVKGLVKLEADSRINVAINLFALNRFHALPVVDGKRIIGIITTHDIMVYLDKHDDEDHPQ